MRIEKAGTGTEHEEALDDLFKKRL